MQRDLVHMLRNLGPPGWIFLLSMHVETNYQFCRLTVA